MTQPDNSTEREREDSALSVRTLWRSFLELFALSGIAFAQPLFDLLSKSSGLFFSRGTTGFQTILLALLILLVPPLVALLIEAAVGALFPQFRNWAHVVLAGLFFAVIAVEVVKKASSFGPSLLLAIGVVLGGLGALLLLRSDIFRQFLRLLSIAPLIFALLFLFASPVTDVVFGGDTSAADVGIAHPKRVVLVVLDEFPEMSLLDGSGKIDRDLYPNFADFADDATWYRNETTVAPYTSLAVPAIVTGQYPHSADALPEASAYPDSLFTLLGKAYGMNVHEPVTRLCPQNLCKSATGSGFGSLVTASAKLWRQFASPNRTVASFNFTDVMLASLGTGLKVAQEFTADLAPATGPQLDYAHVELPHQPWELVKSLQTYPQDPILSIQWPDASSAQVARMRHLLQVQATDTLLGQMMTKLKKVDGYEDSMIIVTADHGVSFENGQPVRAATEKNAAEIMWPPLLIKYPGQQTGRIDDRPAQSIDILPTIAEVVGVKVPWRVDGSSLLGPAKPDFPRRLYQYKVPNLTPEGAPAPPPGEKYLTFDAAKYFPEVLEGQAAPSDGDPNLRLYRLGEFGDLVGKPAAPLVGATVNVGAQIRDLAKYDDVDKSADDVPWAHGEGFVGPLPEPQWIAVTLNGTIAAVSQTVPLESQGGFLDFMVPPELIRDGKNEVNVYLVNGTPKAPKLSPVVSIANFKG